jgi:hypothetical protein
VRQTGQDFLRGVLAEALGFHRVRIRCGQRQVNCASVYCSLRRRKVAHRKTIDMIIGTYCLVHDLELLHADQDFDVLENPFGLRVVRKRGGRCPR